MRPLYLLSRVSWQSLKQDTEIKSVRWRNLRTKGKAAAKAGSGILPWVHIGLGIPGFPSFLGAPAVPAPPEIGVGKERPSSTPVKKGDFRNRQHIHPYGGQWLGVPQSWFCLAGGMSREYKQELQWEIAELRRIQARYQETLPSSECYLIVQGASVSMGGSSAIGQRTHGPA